MSVYFNYELTGRGGSQCTLTIDSSSVTITASYLSDALRSLLSAFCRILSGATESTASFTEAPGEYRWKLYRLDEYQMRLVILEFHEMWAHKPDEEGTIIFDTVYRFRPIAGAVYHGCKELLSQHGREGYNQMWHANEFPDAEFSALAKLLREKPTKQT